MKLYAMIFSVLAIGLNIPEIVGQCLNNNNLTISEIKSLLSQTQQSVRDYLSTILVDTIIKNVDSIFASASSKLTSLVNNSYSCARLKTTTKSNFYVLL